ncbi:hypothetical protein AV540_00200 [Brevibacillus parabrevis]|nr:hypothetical protein AV540_00200 [Brevibacillus parabrevis]
MKKARSSVKAINAAASFFPCLLSGHLVKLGNICGVTVAKANGIHEGKRSIAANIIRTREVLE